MARIVTPGLNGKRDATRNKEIRIRGEECDHLYGVEKRVGRPPKLEFLEDYIRAWLSHK